MASPRFLLRIDSMPRPSTMCGDFIYDVLIRERIYDEFLSGIFYHPLKYVFESDYCDEFLSNCMNPKFDSIFNGFNYDEIIYFMDYQITRIKEVISTVDYSIDSLIVVNISESFVEFSTGAEEL